MSVWGDIFSGDALAGAGAGAATGATVGGGWGALAGGAIGLGLGAYAHDQRANATQGQVNNLQSIINNMKAMTSQSYDQHIADLKKAQSFFGPAEMSWSRLYGQGAPASVGQADWGNTGFAGK